MPLRADMGTLALFLGQTRPVLVVWPRKRIQAAGQNRVMTPYIVVGEADGGQTPSAPPPLRLPPTSNRAPAGEQSARALVDPATPPPAGEYGVGARLQRALGRPGLPRRKRNRAQQLEPGRRGWARRREDGGGQGPLRRGANPGGATGTTTTASRRRPPTRSASPSATAAPPLPQRRHRRAPADKAEEWRLVAEEQGKTFVDLGTNDE
jgi:hypothetical protein